MATHSSVLAWRIPGTGEPGGLPSMGLHRVRHDWNDLAAVAAGAYLMRSKRVSYNWEDRGEANKGMDAANSLKVSGTIISHLCVSVCVWIPTQFSHSIMSNFLRPMDCSTPGLPVHYQLLEPAQTHVHCIGDAIQPSHPLSSPSPAFNISQHQGLFQWVDSLYQVAKVLEFQLQHQSFQWIFRTDFL